MSSKIITGLAGMSSVELSDDNGNLMVRVADTPEFPVRGDITLKSDNEILIGDKTIKCGKRIAEIKIEGNVESVNHVPIVRVIGNVSTVHTTCGNIYITGNVSGAVSAVSGDIKVKGDVSGPISTVSGDVNVKKS